MESLLVKKYKIVKDSPEYFFVLFTLTKPEKISTTLIEEKAVLKSALKISKQKSTFVKEASTLAKKYGWLPVFLATAEPWGSEHYKQALTEVLTKDIQETQNKYIKLKNYTLVRNKEFKSVCGKYKITPRDAQIFIDFGLALDTRNEAEYIQSFCGLYLRDLYAEIAKRLYLSTKQVRTLYEAEIIAVLRGKADAQELLNKKGKYIGYGYTKTETQRINLDSREAEELFTHLEGSVKNIHGHDENKGLCANPGTAKGVVKITTSSDQNYKIEPGDILISEVTTVDYLPAMKRAAAIVTELGSLTCHAAVVSREFGIPCIVSLKNATKNFKDGDLVEINANNGMIRRI